MRSRFCVKWFDDSPDGGRALVLISHDAQQIDRMVDRVITVEAGTLLEDRKNVS